MKVTESYKYSHEAQQFRKKFKYIYIIQMYQQLTEFEHSHRGHFFFFNFSLRTF